MGGWGRGKGSGKTHKVHGGLLMALSDRHKSATKRRGAWNGT